MGKRWRRGQGLAGFLLACVLLAVPAAPAADWERFRGPEGAGTSPDRDIPTTWDATHNLLWKVEVPGVGHSSPIISRDRVFLQSASADGKQRWLICLDAATGAKRWQEAAPGTTSRMHPRNTLASSTPAADGKHVFAVFWDGSDIQLCAYDYEGKRLWKRDLGEFRSQHGPGLSPVAADGRVFLNNDQDGSACVLAFDADSGKPLWKDEQRKAFRTCYSTPFLHRGSGGGKELIVASTAGITGYDPASGKAKWEFLWVFKGKPLRTVASPIVCGDLVIANSGDGDGSRHTIAVHMPGRDGDRPQLVWEKVKGVPYVPCMLASEGHLYGVTDQGVAVCRVAATGEEVWTERLGGLVSASPVLINGKVYVPAEDGRVYLFAATTTFKRLAINNLGEPVMASPAVADNRLFIRGKRHLFCIAKTPQRSASR